MYPWTHLIYGLIAAIAGFQLGLINVYMAVVLVVLTVLLDIDHLIYYYGKKRDLNLKRCWNYCVTQLKTRRNMLFHDWRFVIFAILLCVFLYFTKIGWSYVVWAGFFMHYLLDELSLFVRLVKNKIFKIKIFGLIMHLYSYEVLVDIIGLAVLIALIL